MFSLDEKIVNAKVDEILENGDKALSGLPYLYRSKGLPSEVYDVRMTEDIDGDILNRAIADTVIRYPYFNVKFEERDGDFYAVKNEKPLFALNTKELVPLGGHSNSKHLMGITYWNNSLRLSFHHGLTDGRGAKNFLETLVQFYADYKNASEAEYDDVYQKHLEVAAGLSEEEMIDPCENKIELNGKSEKIEGLAGKGYKLPETADKSEHRRYELKFSQSEFMAKCKEIGASPITMLSILMSKGIKAACPDSDKPVVSNFPMDARAILGCDKTFKNCVKSMTLPYGEGEMALSDSEIAAKYKELLSAQKDHDYCAKEFNNINMLLGIIGHFHSFAGRQKLLGFMENLALDTYLISYIGQFNMPSELVSEVHLYSNCSSGLVLNMTCQSGYFVIDLTQDFKTDKYVEALKEQFALAGIELLCSSEIFFETPFDELHEIITSATDTGEQIKGWFEKAMAAAAASSEAAKAAAASEEAARERAEADRRCVEEAKAAADRKRIEAEKAGAARKRIEAEKAGAASAGPKVTALYYDVATGTMKEFDPTKNTQEEMQKLVQNTQSLFIS